MCNLFERKEYKCESNWCVYQPPPVFRRCPLIGDRALVLELSKYGGLGCVVGRRFLLGTNFNIENMVDNYRRSGVRLEQYEEVVFAVEFNDTRRLPAQGCFLDRFVGVREGLWLIAISLRRETFY